MVEINAIILDLDYITHDEKPVMRLFAKGEYNGEKIEIIALDDSFKPYMYIIPSVSIEETIEELENEDIDLINMEKVIKKDFQLEKEFLKVTFKHPQSLAKHRDSIRKLESVEDIREFDIPFYRRYLIDNDITPMNEVTLSGEFIDSFESIKSKKNSLKIFKLDEPPKKVNDDFQKFNILSFDLEVRNPHGMPDSSKDPIIMIGVASNFGLEKVISTKEKANTSCDFIEKVESEKAMIERFVNYINEYDVDIIVGYNSDNFDFPYLKDRAKILDVDLDLGVDGSDIKFIRRGYANAAAIKGLIHVDLYLVMRRYMSLDRYTLERVYFELFGEEKIDVPGDRIWEFWDSDSDDLDNLFDYSLDDVKATIDIAEQTLPLNLELTRIVGQPLFDLSRMATGQQAEWYLVKQAYKDNEVVPNKPTGIEFSSRGDESNEGGYVKEPEKGLHENLVQFDFRSLYPSIIISKNISPDVLFKGKVDEESRDEYFISPEHEFKFKKSPQGFIPSVIGNVLNERLRIKKVMKETDDVTSKKSLDVQQQALKRLANTMYGIYGFSRFRWYSFECAQAITAWGREYIKNSMLKAEEYGFHPIYADTDGFYAEYNGK
ncbi:DNA-directed DNA polymerase [Methanobrevibacter sp. OttesenSCG-928-K11]|nr:DNA-directed DNA polymerase [Methanobrevibacter sp. OttesenSCG-928-K11]